jgi:hypothetical protein
MHFRNLKNQKAQSTRGAEAWLGSKFEAIVLEQKTVSSSFRVSSLESEEHRKLISGKEREEGVGAKSSELETAC